MANTSDITRGPEHQAVVVQLDWNDQSGRVTVTPKDQDRYTLKVQQAIELLNLGHQHQLFQSAFQVLVNRLGEWLSQQSGIREAFLTLRDGGFLFVVVRKDSRLDDDFEDSLTDLDVAIAGDADLRRLRVDVLSLPGASASAIETFCHRDFTITFSGGD